MNWLLRAESFLGSQLFLSQEITRILWNPKIYYRVHKNPSLVPNLSQNFCSRNQLYFLKIHLNIILLLHLGVPSGFLTKTSYISRLPHTCHVPLSSHPFDLITLVFDEYKSWIYLLCNFLHSSFLGPSMFLSTLFSNTLSLSFLWDTNYDTYHKQAKLYFCIFPN
jgi:hypothetical protein